MATQENPSGNRSTSRFKIASRSEVDTESTRFQKGPTIGSLAG